MEKTVHRPGTPAICDRSERAAGFTLVELSIVLVIIGLLVGAITVGHEMIQASYIRSFISQKTEFETATNTFKVKYGSLPGDLPNATNFGFSGTATNAGTGMFLADGASNTTEYYYWHHLYQAGLIVEKPTDANPNGGPGVNIAAGDTSPTCPICNRAKIVSGGVYFAVGGWLIADLEAMPSYWFGQVTYGGGAPIASVGTPVLKRGFILTCANLIGNGCATMRSSDALVIDSKLDDGLPLTGNVIAINYQYSNGQPGFRQPATILTNSYPNTTTFSIDLIMATSF